MSKSKFYLWSAFVPRSLKSLAGLLLFNALLCGFPMALSAQSVTFAGSGAVNFGSANVCQAGQTTPSPCSVTMTLTYNLTEGGTLGTPKALTLGAPDLDFKLASGTTCSGAVTTGSTCVVKVTFAPQFAGQRNGGVQIVDGSGNLLANTYIYGKGIAPELVFRSNNIQSMLGGGFNGDYGLALDASGNVYVADSFNNAVKEIPPGCASSSCVTTLGGGFAYPFGLAVDRSGKVYIADTYNGAVKRMLPGCASSHCVITLVALGATSYPSGVAVDESGNVYVTSNQDGVPVFVIPPGCADSSCVTTLGGGFNQPIGVAVDGSGDVYVANYGQKNIAVSEMPPSCASSSCVTTLGGGFNSPGGVAVDGRGNVYVADTLNSEVKKLDFVNPPSLSLPNTAVGDASSELLTAQNIGNAPLSFSALTVSGDFLQAAGSGTPEDCASNLSLAPDAECSISISFTPTAVGELTGTVTLTDDTMNAPPPNYATQNVSLSGQGIPMNPPVPQLSATTLNYGRIAYGSTETLALQITNAGGNTLTLTTSINGPSYKITGSTCGSGVTAGNSCVLQIEFAPVKIGLHDDILTLTTNGTTNPTVSLLGTATGVGATVTILQFGSIPYGNTEVLPLTIENEGVLGKVTLTEKINGPSYKILTTAENTCLSGIATGQTCTLPVEFNPVSAAWHIDTLTVTAGSTVSTVKLRGLATAP